MPVSPQDFELWSRMTGNPYPQTPAERMALAPHVYDYTRQIGRQGGPTMGPVRRAVDVVGKAALLAGGLAGATYLANKFLPPNDGGGGSAAMPAPKPEVEEVVESIIPTPVAEVEGPTVESVRFAREKARGMSRAELIAQQEKKSSLRRASAQLGAEVMGAEPPIPGAADPYAMREVMAHLSRQGVMSPPATMTVVPTSFRKLSLDNEPGVGSTVAEALPDVTSQAARNSGDVTPATTSQRFGQSIIPDQTSTVQALKGTTAAKPTLGTIEQKPVTQSELIATGQHFSPGTEIEQARTRATETAAASPIAAMASVTSTTPRRQTAESMEDERLARQALGHMPLEEAMELLASARASKGAQIKETPAPVAPAPPQKVITARPSYPVRVSEEVVAPAAKISANEFLSAMSQKLGPIAEHEVPYQRSPGVKSLAFYPGGEIGVQMRRGGGGEYAYATSDPYRLALSDYAEEGFPTGMGKIGGIVSKSGLGPQLGVQKALTRGGEISETQPDYAGLMGAREIAKKLTSKSQRTREQAEYHAETRDMMKALEERAAMRRAGVV